MYNNSLSIRYHEKKKDLAIPRDQSLFEQNNIYCMKIPFSVIHTKNMNVVYVINMFTF